MITGDSLRRAAGPREGRRRRRLQPRRGRGLRGHDRPADRRGACRGWGSTSTPPVVVPDGDPVGDGDRRGRRRPGPGSSLTTGGTGLTPTDRTPEVTRPLLDREVPGIAEAIRAYGVAQGRPDRGALARAGRGGRAGVVVNLPGSRGGVKDGLAVLEPLLRARRRADRRERPLSGASLARRCCADGDVDRCRPSAQCGDAPGVARGPRPQRRLAEAVGRDRAAGCPGAARDLPRAGPRPARAGPRGRGAAVRGRRSTARSSVR